MTEQEFPGKIEHSYIDVILKDGTYHHFTPRVLDVLLESHRVHKFKRSNGWATVGIDPIRAKELEKDQYQGQERRISVR
jgi:hypothetical protein